MNRFREVFEAKVAGGLSPNEAAAEALLEMNEEEWSSARVWETFSSVEAVTAAFSNKRKLSTHRNASPRKTFERLLRDVKLENVLSNALDALCSELSARQGDANAALAWCVLLEHPEIATRPVLLRSTLVALGAAMAEAREAFGRFARAIPTRRRWGELVQDHMAVLVATGAEHSELLHCARALDALGSVDAELRGICRTTNELLNDRLADDEHLVSQTYRTWSPSAPGSSLLSFPYLLDAASKARFLRAESRRAMYGAAINSLAQPFFVVAVSRDKLLSDSLSKIVRADDSELRKQLKVAFRGEEGVDEGGVANEFLQLATKSLFSPSRGNFVEEEGGLWFSRSSDRDDEFELAGILLGIAIHNSILVDAPFPLPLWKKLLDKPVDLEDLRDASPAVAKSLDTIRTADRAFFDATEMSFEASFGSVTVPLGDNGTSRRVSPENAEEFVSKYVEWYLSGGRPFLAFRKGFERVVGGNVWKLLTPADLELLVRGSKTLDFAAWRSAAVYEDGYDDDSQTVNDFWTVVDELEHPLKLKLLKFVTGSDRAPINGLAASRFVISRVGATDHLPSSHTCFHHLVLPDYKNLEKTRAKLLIAIKESYEGFGLR
ncbi:hypothetical protein CTAYLR_004640 [Chrysophaeum taylorii]|uniref:HECT-type E3 ubiquitin transferase n=1 Tax=Chrysophaeum taylorii TaxID=2483200 RepID=A0AAD7XNJ7_9STRA|nr:hypothetical protein CTAYLR_004640 [Chrysophaeum taylorii]